MALEKRSLQSFRAFLTRMSLAWVERDSGIEEMLESSSMETWRESLKRCIGSESDAMLGFWREVRLEMHDLGYCVMLQMDCIELKEEVEEGLWVELLVLLGRTTPKIAATVISTKRMVEMMMMMTRFLVFRR